MTQMNSVQYAAPNAAAVVNAATTRTIVLACLNRAKLATAATSVNAAGSPTHKIHMKGSRPAVGTGKE